MRCTSCRRVRLIAVCVMGCNWDTVPEAGNVARRCAYITMKNDTLAWDMEISFYFCKNMGNVYRKHVG